MTGPCPPAIWCILLPSFWENEATISPAEKRAEIWYTGALYGSTEVAELMNL